MDPWKWWKRRRRRRREEVTVRAANKVTNERGNICFQRSEHNTSPVRRVAAAIGQPSRRTGWGCGTVNWSNVFPPHLCLSLFLSLPLSLSFCLSLSLSHSLSPHRSLPSLPFSPSPLFLEGWGVMKAYPDATEQWCWMSNHLCVRYLGKALSPNPNPTQPPSFSPSLWSVHSKSQKRHPLPSFIPSLSWDDTSCSISPSLPPTSSPWRSRSQGTTISAGKFQVVCVNGLGPHTVDTVRGLSGIGQLKR